MAIQRHKFLLELKDEKPEDVIAGFKAVHAIPILDLLDGFLKKDVDKTNKFLRRFHLTNNDKNTLSDWAADYFQDYFKADVKEIMDVISKYSTRELIVLGDVFDNELGVKKDNKKAFQYYQLAAIREDQDPIAICTVAYCYRAGIGVASDNAAAETNYEKAHRLGWAIASMSLAVLIEERDPERTVNLTFQAAENESAGACLNLGFDIERGKNGFTKDIDMARKCYASAAIRGHKKGMYAYGMMVPATDQVKFFRLAAIFNSKIAQNKLEELFSKPGLTPGEIYHITLGLRDSVSPKLSAELKKSFSDLYTSKPEEIARLSKELDDQADDIFSLLDDARSEELTLASSFLLNTVTIALLPTPVFKICCDYLSPAMRTALEKEKLAKEDVQILMEKKYSAQEYRSSLFYKSAKQAEKGKVSCHSVMRNSF